MERVIDRHEPPAASSRPAYWRNLAAFWLFGLCNNFAYVIMLSAAEDILAQQENSTALSNHTAGELSCADNSTTRACDKISTGAVLLADIVPTLLVKLTAPFYMEAIPYGVRNTVVVAFQALSYLIVAFSGSVGVSLFGVVCASFGSGLGEIMFLSMSNHFDPNVISTWSSGTGGAGIFGSIAYAGITQMGVSPRDTVLIMLIVPALMAATYWLLMVVPSTVWQCGLLEPSSWIVPKERRITAKKAIEGPENSGNRTEQDPDSTTALTSSQPTQMTLREKFALVGPLLKYMAPLTLVYIGEYFINQGLQEMIIFQCSFLKTKASQYRWYQVLYQVGVFTSRSSVNLLHFSTKIMPLFAALQLANAVLFLAEALYLYIPSIWVVFALIFYEGLLGGAVYVNTFYNIRQQHPWSGAEGVCAVDNATFLGGKVAAEHVEFSLGVTSVADTLGIVVAGFSSIPVHNWLCGTALSPSRIIH